MDHGNLRPRALVSGCAPARLNGMQGATETPTDTQPPGPARPQSPADPAVRERFRQQRREGTHPETALRGELHRRGRRFRVQYPVPGLPRRRIDVAFTRLRLAVFVDGCFWHGCPDHFVPPIRNREWWLAKIEVNQSRDRGTDEQLRAAGWEPLRLWEHVSPGLMADLVEQSLNQITLDAPFHRIDPASPNRGRMASPGAPRIG